MDAAYKARKRKQIELEKAASALTSNKKGLVQIFNWFNNQGLIPRTTQRKKYKTVEQFLAAVQKQFNTVRQQNPDLSNSKILNQALNNMAVKQRVGQARGDIEIVMNHQTGLAKTGNVDYQGIPLKVTDEGMVRVDNRAYMDDLPKPVREFLLKTESVQDVQAYEKAYKAEWKEMGALSKAVLAKYGINFDRGHFTSNRAGGARSARAASLELSALNRLHGAEARQNLEALAQAGRSDSWLSDYFLWKLSQANLAVLGADYLTDADFEAISQGADVNQLLLKNLQDVEQGNFQSLANKPSLVGQSLGDKTLPEASRDEFLRLRAKERQTGINPADEKLSTLRPEFIRKVTPSVGTIRSKVERTNGHILMKNGSLRFLKKRDPLPSFGIGDVAVSGAFEYLTNPDATLQDSLMSGAVDAVVGQIENGPLSPVEMTSLGNGDQVSYDPTRNKVLPTYGVKESNGNKGIAYENGEAKLVEYGSVAGIKPDHEILAEGIAGVAQASASKIKNNLIPELLDAPFEIINGAIKFVNGH